MPPLSIDLGELTPDVVSAVGNPVLADLVKSITAPEQPVGTGAGFDNGPD